MKFKTYLSLFVLSFLLNTACQDKNEVLDEENPVLQLRIMNQTFNDLDSIVSNDHEFGSLSAGSSTDYFEFDIIPARPEVSLLFNGDTYIWDSPIDDFSFWAATHDSGSYSLIITGLTSSYLVEANLRED